MTWPPILPTELAPSWRNRRSRSLGGFPNATFVVDLQTDYQLGYATQGELVTPAPSTGMHGYLPSHPEMRSSFFLRGKGIAAGRDLGIIDMRQIAPTLAADSRRSP